LIGPHRVYSSSPLGPGPVQKSPAAHVQGTTLIRKCLLLGTYSGRGLFLMSDEPGIHVAPSRLKKEVVQAEPFMKRVLNSNLSGYEVYNTA